LFAVGLRWESIASLIAGAGGSTADTVAKAIVHRARPTADIVHVVQVVSGYSFPSGHVVFYTAFFGFLMFLAYSLFKDRVVWRSTAIFILDCWLLREGRRENTKGSSCDFARPKINRAEGKSHHHRNKK
jgi:membrane-associated phospholipid phosphatase